MIYDLANIRSVDAQAGSPPPLDRPNPAKTGWSPVVCYGTDTMKCCSTNAAFQLPCVTCASLASADFTSVTSATANSICCYPSPAPSVTNGCAEMPY